MSGSCGDKGPKEGQEKDKQNLFCQLAYTRANSQLHCLYPPEKIYGSTTGSCRQAVQLLAMKVPVLPASL